MKKKGDKDEQEMPMKAGESDLLSGKLGDCVMVTPAPAPTPPEPLPCVVSRITMSSFSKEGYSKLSYNSRKLDSNSVQNHHPLESVSSYPSRGYPLCLPSHSDDSKIILRSNCLYTSDRFVSDKNIARKKVSSAIKKEKKVAKKEK